MMPVLRVFLVLLALLSGGLAHASYSFDSALRASDAELDSMRGGFVVSWNGLEFLMPFSITGIERLTQVGSQTYLNGELISPKLNPQALIPISQMNQISVGVQTQTADLASSGSGGASTGAAGGGSTSTDSTGGSPANSSTAAAGTGAAVSDGVVAGIGTAGTRVATNGSLIVIQNGSANAVALPSNVSLDSLATFIQNSVNNQVIRNITTMNITLEAQMLAAQARLNSIRNQSLNGLR
jgi:hypothetical protein